MQGFISSLENTFLEKNTFLGPSAFLGLSWLKFFDQSSHRKSKQNKNENIKRKKMLVELTQKYLEKYITMYDVSYSKWIITQNATTFC